jgi:hypothetical protein
MIENQTKKDQMNIDLQTSSKNTVGSIFNIKGKLIVNPIHLDPPEPQPISKVTKKYNQSSYRLGNIGII